MGWLFVQVWVLCVVAFLLGSLVTWLLFVRPARRADPPPGGQPWALGPSWTDPPQARVDRELATVPPPSEPPPAPAVDPALSGLDSRPEQPSPRLGAAATGALDLLGVRGRGDEPTAAQREGPAIPTQAGPADAPQPDGHPPSPR